MIWKSPKQKRAVMAFLRESGFLGKLAARAKVSPTLLESIGERALRKARISQRHLDDFDRLLVRGVHPSDAGERIRLGGILPAELDKDRLTFLMSKLSAGAELTRFETEAGVRKISFSSGGPYPISGVKVASRVFVASKPGTRQLSRPIVHPLLEIEVRQAHSRRAIHEIDDLFAGWHSSASSFEAAKLRKGVRDLLYPVPVEKVLRPTLKDYVLQQEDVNKQQLAMLKYVSLSPRALNRYEKSLLKKKLRIVRGAQIIGYRLTPDEASYLKDVYTANQALLRKINQGKDTITLYRGIGRYQHDYASMIERSMDQNGVALVPIDTLSSWTESRKRAVEFATGDNSILIRANIPIERSLVSYRIAGKGIEKEHIIMGERFWLTRAEIEYGPGGGLEFF